MFPSTDRIYALALVGGVLATGVATSSPSSASLVRLDSDAYPAAKCLDGSPGAFYFRAATAAENRTRWVFSLEGGGECVDKASCEGRALSQLGSSKKYGETMDLGQLQSGEPYHNPDLCTYNQVFVKYCSGDLHLGKQSAPATIENLQFSGHRIIEAVLQTLNGSSYGLGDAELVVWSGDSAGGIGSVANLDFVADALPRARVVGAPIGGFYFSNNITYNGTDPPPASFIPWDYKSLKGYFTFWDAFVPERCVASGRAATPWQCMFANASYDTLESELFVIEGQTDRVVLPLHNGLPAVWDKSSECRDDTSNCPQDMLDFMDVWRGEMMSSTAKVSARDRDGIFHPACLIHTSFKLEQPLIRGTNYLTAFTNWLFKRGDANHNFVDTCGVMCNPSCHGL